MIIYLIDYNLKYGITRRYLKDTLQEEELNRYAVDLSRQALRQDLSVFSHPKVMSHAATC